jgi:PAS domain S-box-containing protein
MHPQVDGQRHDLTDAQRLQLIVDALVDYAVYMLDVDGFITTWNSGAERIDGYRAVEIIGQHFSRFFTPEDRANGLPDEILEDARRVGRRESEGWRVRKDGSRFLANSIVQVVRDENRKLIGFVKITRDITEKAAAQQALLESERRFRLLVESVWDYAIYMLDLSGIVTNWNPGAERLKGYAADEIVGQHFSKFYTKEDRAIGFPARVLETAAREGRYEGEGWRVRKDGSRFWASVVVHSMHTPDGQLAGFAKITRDISERQAAQQALLESERQFRLLVEGVSDYAIFMLDPNGNIVSWNAGAKRIKGYTSAEIIGQHFSRFYTEQDRAAGLPARALFTASREGRFEMEGWRVRKDGNLFWANVVIDPIHDEKGDLIGYAKITRDISERREAQKALEQSQAQRARAQKMEALGQLTGGVAHDFNNLLMVVTGHMQTIKKAASDDPKVARAVEAIELATKRGAALTRQLLTFSRRQTFNPTIIALDKHVDEFRNLLTSSVKESAQLLTHTAPGIWPVKADEDELELALVNLALNARDAMPHGGDLTLTLENVTLSPADTDARLTGDFVAIRMTDSGVGIAPDVLAKVFDPFFTTKGANKGTGLGLSQVHGFAHQSGGTVAIQSALGRGTTVTIYLPRVLDDLSDRSEPETEAFGIGRVLVVEDNPDVSEASALMLSELGYQVQTAPDAEAALREIDTREFDLVISDIMMPGKMDGLALARTLRTTNPNVPILLVTGYSQAGAAAGGEFNILSKPFHISELSRVAARLIAESRQPPITNLVRLKDVRRSITPEKGGN